MTFLANSLEIGTAVFGHRYTKQHARIFMQKPTLKILINF